MRTIDPIMPAAVFETVELDIIPGLLEQTAKAGTLVVGVHEIWKQLWHNEPLVLLVEEGFVCLAWHVDMENICVAANEVVTGEVSSLKNITEDIIGRVEAAGGAVVSLPAGCLGQYQGMALVLEQPPVFSIY
ncbi:hypothetical protein [Filimonas effusa]|uniref:Uncharacterized protein n=1 Tax=Filimonas effusa TaxID=2508721 RepID=A0A4Q1DDH9_9BACT|nr:hypothetical protein [Filimonas effusa]RXK86935.1 hypothetical protein ESB13_09160 [Filimonas effusa]